MHCCGNFRGYKFRLNKTRVMFGANLSFKLLEKYLDLFVSAGFVLVDDSFFW